MCLALIGQVSALDQDGAEVAEVMVAGIGRRVSLQMLEGAPVAVGDHLLLQFGYAMARLTDEEVRETEAALEEFRSGSQDWQESRDGGERP